MVLGIIRERSTLARQFAAPERPGPIFGWDDWLIERGAVTWEGTADLTGGFPGFASHGGRLDGCQVRVTERFFLVDEGRGRGFGLPLAWLIDADTIPSPFRGDRGETVLRVRFNDRDRARTFLVRFRGPFLAPRGGRRADQALAALRSAGLEAGSEALPPLPEIAHSWLEASRFEQENVIWSGVASASLGPGNETEPCDVWLTTRSVIWGGGMGDGVLRLPLEHLMDVVSAELDGRGRAPALYLACGDAGGGRHDLPFVFDRQHPPQRCHRERGALLVGLRSRGISLGAVSPPPQPWRSPLAQVAATNEPVAEHRASEDGPFRIGARTIHRSHATASNETGLGSLTILASKRQEKRVALDPVGDPGTDDPAAWSLGPERPSISSPTKTAPGDDLDHPLLNVRHVGREGLALVPKSPDTAVSTPPPVHLVPPVHAGSPLAVVDAFEDAIVAVLIEAAQGIDRGLNGAAWAAPVVPVPSSAQQMAAHLALDEAVTGGLLETEEIRTRRCRLIAVGDAGPRLRSLLELRAVQLISDVQLAQKRSEIMAPLGDVLQGGGR